MGQKYHLFEVYGIELEYMLVSKKTFKVQSSVDTLFVAKTGEYVSDVDNGDIAWSNELVSHVVELKTNGPTKSLDNLSKQFHDNILEINDLLLVISSNLLPTAAHPTMDPATDSKLWEHEASEIYELYNRIFGCKGHGWNNLQSMHINLPFYDDSEFEKLHAAIRIILPLIPGLSASSPILDGKYHECKDARLHYYKSNQKKIPHLTGLVIPEQVFCKDEYYKQIFQPIQDAIRPYDDNNILDHHFLNSRGAIARFDRNAIEIRVIDLQECPAADIAIAAFIIELLKLLVSEKWISLEEQKSWSHHDLFKILDKSITYADAAIVDDEAYIKMLGFQGPTRLSEIWSSLYLNLKANIHPQHYPALETILERGSLSTRIHERLGNQPTADEIRACYEDLASCLAKNESFVP